MASKEVTPIVKQRGRAKGSKMSADQVAAMQRGREAAKAVENFIAFCDGTYRPDAPKKKSTIDTAAKVAKLQAKLNAADGYIAKLKIQAQIERVSNPVMSEPVVADEDIENILKLHFIAHAKWYSEKHDVPRSAFAALGVPEDVLEDAFK